MEKIEFFKKLFEDNLLELREFKDLFPVIILKKTEPEKLENFIARKKDYNQFYKFLPIFLNLEFINNAKDSFPADILYIKDFSNNIFGEDNFKNIQIDNNFLRLNIERELRSKLFVITSSSYAFFSKNDISRFAKDLLYSLRYVIYAFAKLKNLSFSFNNEIDLFISLLNLFNYDKSSLVLDVINSKENYNSIKRFSILYDCVNFLISKIEI
ncbi:MAG: hypothetical protein ACK4YF_03715 [Exilispira sp.]